MNGGKDGRPDAGKRTAVMVVEDEFPAKSKEGGSALASSDLPGSGEVFEQVVEVLKTSRVLTKGAANADEVVDASANVDAGTNAGPVVLDFVDLRDSRDADDEAALAAIDASFPGFKRIMRGIVATSQQQGASESGEVTGFSGFEKVLGAEILGAGGEELTYVTRFFDDFVEGMGLQDSEFFRHAECQEHFRQAFAEFRIYLDRQIKDIEDLTNEAVHFHQFFDNWQSLMRMAGYYAFFVHYGATRSGEKDSSDKPKQYVYHPVRSAFKIMGKRMWYLSEPEFVAAILHDTREDAHKGMLAVLTADKNALDHFAADSDTSYLARFARQAKTIRRPEALRFFAQMEAYFDDQVSRSGKQELSVSELLTLLTKKSDNRSRAFLRMMGDILQYDRSGRLFEAAVALDVVKASDRFDNTSSESPGHSASRIKEETAYLFLARAIAMGAWNQVDWWHDYLIKFDPWARKTLSDLIRGVPAKPAGRGKGGRGRQKCADDLPAVVSAEVANGSVEAPSVTLKDEFRREFHELLLDELFCDELCASFHSEVTSTNAINRLIPEASSFPEFIRGIFSRIFPNYDQDFLKQFSDLFFANGFVDAVADFEEDALFDLLEARFVAILSNDAVAGQLKSDPRRAMVLDRRGYVLAFRPIGDRYENIYSLQAHARRGTLQKTFRNYVIPYSILTDRALSEAIARVMCGLCPHDLDRGHLRRPELRTDLGSRIVNSGSRYGVSIDAHGKSPKYGVVVWGVPKHQREAVEIFHGDYHLGKFDLGSDPAKASARDRVEGFYRKVAPEVVSLQKQYGLVDRFAAGVSEGASVKEVGGWIKIALAKVGGLLKGKDITEKILSGLKVGPLKNEVAEKVRAFLDKQVLLLFMYKEERRLVINGKEVKGLVPKKLNDEQAACFLCPLVCLGRRLEKVSDGVFQVHSGSFNEGIYRSQLNCVDTLLGDYRRELISDELSAWRDDSVRRPPTGR